MRFKLGGLSCCVSVLGLAGLAGLAGCDTGGETSLPGGGGTASGAATGGTGVAGSVTSGGGGMAGAAAGGPSAGAAGSSVGGQAGGSGGAAGAAGQPTGGTGSGGGGGGSAPCAYKLCEGFEGGTDTALPAGWTSLKGYGVASPQDQVVTTAEFHSGAKALQSTSATKGISRIQKDLTPLGATASKHWGRVFYKVKSPAAKLENNVLHVTFISLFGATENRVVDTVTDPDGKHQWLFNNPNDQGGKASSYNWAFDADWHCAEWFVDVGAKSYRFFYDSEEVTEIAFSEKQDSQMSEYKTLIVGATHYQDNTLTPPFVVWFDDLAVNDTQIGCN